MHDNAQTCNTPTNQVVDDSAQTSNTPTNHVVNDPAQAQAYNTHTRLNQTGLELNTA